MYVIFASVIIIIFIFFWQSIYNIFTIAMSKTTKTTSSFIGNLWFICLFMINLTIVSFIYLFYNYKSTTKGEIGLDGEKGFDGKPGEICSIKSENCNTQY